MPESNAATTAARAFASFFGYDLDLDVERVGLLQPHVVPLDADNGPLVHVTDDSGADYYTARIDYGADADHVSASRVFAAVMNGHRTKMAYWPQSANPKELTVVKGSGWLIMGDPYDGDDIEAVEQLRYYSVDAAVTPIVILQPGTFYTFQAAQGDTELVVTGLSARDESGNWEQTEVYVEPGMDSVTVPGEGMVLVPEEFSDAYFD